MSKDAATSIGRMTVRTPSSVESGNGLAHAVAGELATSTPGAGGRHDRMKLQVRVHADAGPEQIARAVAAALSRRVQ